MAFTLRLTVHGVLGCVERMTDEGKPAFTVLCCAYEHDNEKLVPFVRFPRHSYKGTREILGDDSTLGHLFLKGEHLTVQAEAAPADAALKLNKNKDPISTTPTAFDAESLLWIPDIERLADGHGTIKSAYFANPPKARPELVARLDLTKGRVGTTGVERVLVPFTDGKRRAIAREIRMQMKVQENHFTLQSRSLNGSSSQPEDMVFTAEPDGTLDIVFGHDTKTSIYNPVPPIAPIDVIQNQAREEYRFYYTMRQNAPDDTPPLPLVSSRPGGEPFCSPSKFKG
jgi:hypothetical protein